MFHDLTQEQDHLTLLYWCYYNDNVRQKYMTNSLYVQVSVYAPADLIDDAALAIDVAPKILSFYEDFYNIPYPLTKSGMFGFYSVGHYLAVYIIPYIREFHILYVTK